VETTPSPTPETILPSPQLATLANEANVTISTQIVAYELDNPTYTEAAREVANMATCAGDMDVLKVFNNVSWKTILDNWGYVSSTLGAGQIPYQNQLNFNDADKFMNYAKENNMPVMSQFLFYSQDMPTDIESAKLSKDNIFKIVEYYVKARVLKYRGQISAWNVTNEVVAGKLYGGESFKFWYASSWSDELIADVYKWAHEVDPNAQLLLSENNVLDKSFDPIGPDYISYLKKLKEEGVPITTAGLQNQFWVYDPPNKSYMEQMIKRIQALGLNVMFTETTVSESAKYTFWTDRPRAVGTITDLDQAQAKIYQDTLQAALDTSSIFGIFGFTDAVSEFDSEPGNYNAPDAKAMILDANFQPKPAYDALVKALEAYIASK